MIQLFHSPPQADDQGSVNIFSNDGSFMSQFKALLEKQKQDTKEKEEHEKQNEEVVTKETYEQGQNEEEHDKEFIPPKNDERRKSGDKGQR